MPIAESVLIGLGGAIGNAMITLAMGDNKTAADVGKATLGAGKSWLEKNRGKTEATREMEAKGRRIAETVVQIFERDGGLDEESREAALLDATEAIKGARIDAALVTGLDLDAEAVTKHVLTPHEAPRAESAIFRDGDVAEPTRRIVLESMRHLIANATLLPGFTATLGREQFQRLNTIRDEFYSLPNHVADTLDERQRLTRAAEELEFEARYRDAVITTLDWVQLIGVELSPTGSRQPLSVAYVALRSTSVRRPEPERLAREDKASQLRQDAGESEVTVSESVGNVLARTDRLLARGEAGGGKTTLLKWIAVRSASGDFAPELGTWNDTVPFFIRLRGHAEGNLPSTADPAFLGHAGLAIAGRCPRGWIESQLMSGRAIVLVDGLDEVSAALRDDVHEWLRGLVNAYPRARFIVTSRPSGAPPDWAADLRFEHTFLAPLDAATIPAFVSQWHDAMAANERLDAAERDKLPSLANDLIATIRTRPRLRMLAGSPLLCALICALHRERKYNLPTERVALYGACLQALAYGRDPAQDVRLPDLPDVEDTVKHDVLRDFAYWMLRNGLSEVSVEAADDHFERRLASMRARPPAVTGMNMRKLLVARSGLLREPVPGRIDFVHRTFLEYLAAEAILEVGDTPGLRLNAHDDQWREVILLATGMGRVRERRDIIRGLLERGDSEANVRATTKISDDGLIALQNLALLRDLDLSFTEITDAGIDHLYALQNLELLDLRETRTTPAGVDAMQRAFPNCTIRSGEYEVPAAARVVETSSMAATPSGQA